MSINKSDLIDAVAETGLSKKSATAAVDTVFSTITTSLQNGVAVALAGFGTFERTFRGERTGYNPQTRKPMMIAASYSVRFKLAKKVKEAVNQEETAKA
jgi:DNA-binding protein HU-beta